MVTGIGGVFLRVRDPKALLAWYATHLGVRPSGFNSANFVWNECDQPEGHGMTVLSFFPSDTRYFGCGEQTAMVNFRVDDLEGLLKRLRAEGVKIDPKREDHDYGRFAWIYDPEGNRVELWQPLIGKAALPDEFCAA